MDNFLKLIMIFLILALFVSLLWSFNYIANVNLSNRESVMLGILQTIFSLVASWIMSHLYAYFQHQKDITEIKNDYQKNLKTYALKASEKVDNLSNELARLVLYLQQELDAESDTLENELLSKEERIESAIHIINTLKSVNDKSLSDWQGVIPQELGERREEQKAEMKELLELRRIIESKYEKILEHPEINEDENTGEDENELGSIKEDIQTLRKYVEYLTLSKFGSIPHKTSKKIKFPLKEDIVKKCLNCDEKIIYKQRPKESSVKEIKCPKCNNLYISRWHKDNGFLLLNESSDEKYICSTCHSEIIFTLKNNPNTKKGITCSSCQSHFQATRSLSDFSVTEVKSIVQAISTEEEVAIDEDLLIKVQQKLPPQPWPTGTSTKIRRELGIGKKAMQKIISTLISRGAYKVQINGKLYEEISPIS